MPTKGVVSLTEKSFSLAICKYSQLSTVVMRFCNINIVSAFYIDSLILLQYQHSASRDKTHASQLQIAPNECTNIFITLLKLGPLLQQCIAGATQLNLILMCSTLRYFSGSVYS